MSMRMSVLIGLFVAVSAARATETYEFSRYQIILDRGPFGPVTATSADAAPPWTARFTPVGFVYSNSVLPQAIIQDKEGNRSYFKAEGEAIDDVKVVSIDVTARKLVVQKGLEKATLTVEQRPNTPIPGGITGQPPQPTGVPGAPGAATPGPRRIPFRRGN